MKLRYMYLNVSTADSYLAITDIAGMGFAVKPVMDAMVELSFKDNKPC